MAKRGTKPALSSETVVTDAAATDVVTDAVTDVVTEPVTETVPGGMVGTSTLPDGTVVPTGIVAHETAASLPLDLADWMTDENVARIEESRVPAGWATIEAGLEVEPADIVIRLPGAHTLTAARALGAFYLGKLGTPLELVRPDGVVIEVLVPPAGGRAVRAPRQEASAPMGNLSRALAALGESRAAVRAADRDWSIWTDEEMAASYKGGKGVMGLKGRIDAAIAANNIGALRAFDFVGAREDQDTTGTTTLSRRAGRYLRAWIGKVEVRLAEQEAERTAEADRIAAQFEARLARLSA